MPAASYDQAFDDQGTCRILAHRCKILSRMPAYRDTHPNSHVGPALAVAFYLMDV